MSAFNGSGTFVISGVGLPYVTATVISSTVANQLNTDLATGLSNCLTKDGQTVPINNIPMGGFRLTGLGAPVAPGDALSYGNPATFSSLSAASLTVGQNINSASQALIINTDPGGGARAQWVASNGSSNMNIGQFGTGYTPSGMDVPGGGFIYSTNQMSIYSVNASPMVFGINVIERMRLDSNGCFGIGISNPVEKLTVRETTKSQTAHFISTVAQGCYINIANGATDCGYLGAATGITGGAVTDFALANATNNSIVFGINNAEKARFASLNGGSLLVGNTVAPAVMDAGGGMIFAQRGFITTNGNGILIDNNNIIAMLTNARIDIICGSGGVRLSNGATSWAAISDDTLKTGYAPFVTPMAKINAIKAGTGRYLTDDPAISRAFLSGQDILAVLPEAVEIDPDTLIPWVKAADLVPLLIAAMKEVDTRLTAGGL